MARNGSGTYTRVNTFVAGNTITAAGHNQNWADIETEVTNSVAADGQTTITGPIKFSAGSNAAPALTFATDTDTGFYRSAANETGVAAEGVKVASFGTATCTFFNSVVVSGTAVFTTGIGGTANFIGRIIASATAQFSNVIIASATAQFSAPIIASATCTFTLPPIFKSYPPAASFKNLVIKVASNTTVTVTADYVTTTDNSTFQTVSVSSTVNLGTTGVDALDTGSIAIDTWYHIWVIAKSDGTTKCLASTSATSPTMPTGYTYKARVGAVQTIHASATLYGTWQIGRRTSYIVGVAQTSTLPVIANGSTGTYSSTSPSLAAKQVTGNGFFAPPTAASIIVTAMNAWKGGSQSAVLVDSSSAYGSTNTGPRGSGGFVHHIYIAAAADGQQESTILLESNSIYIAMDASGGVVVCKGWDDNI